MPNTITEKRITFKMPESITRSEGICPHCLIKYYIVNGKEVCGECLLEKAHKKKENIIRDHYNKNGDTLGYYNREKAEKSRQRDEKKKEDYKKRAAGDNS